MDESDPCLWFRDAVNQDFVQLHRFQDILFSGKTRYQSVKVIQTAAFGRCLILDDRLQSAERDEFIYHEALAHPALIAHANPRSVFIAGGGEGATLREVLRHSSVEKVTMVDLDGETVDICKRYLPHMHQDAFDDPRAEVHFGDARQYLSESEEKFDVIIVDVTDPVQGGPSHPLFTREFYRVVQAKLEERGILVVQSGSCTLDDLDVFATINATLSSVFPLVFPYQAHVPSFGSLWGFHLASNDIACFALSMDELEQRIANRLTGKTGFYDGTTHRSLFALPKYLRQALRQERPALADQNL